MRSKQRTAQWGCSAALLLGLGGARFVSGQEPADQDKTGQGSTEKKQLSPEEQASNATLRKAKEERKAESAKRKGKSNAALVAAGNPEVAAKPSEKIAYDYELPGADGKGVPLSGFRGKVLLVVNLARNSSYNGQLAALEKLSEHYRDKGVVVLGVPSNDFGAAEPGADPEIQKIYKVDNKVTFPVMAKSSLAGTSELPLYGYLTNSKGAPVGGPIQWNYTKFLVDKTGKVVARFSPDVAPDSPELTSTLEQLVSGRYKPHKKPEQASPGEDDDDGGF